MNLIPRKWTENILEQFQVKIKTPDSFNEF